MKGKGPLKVTSLILALCLLAGVPKILKATCVTNQEVLKRVDEERTLLHMIDRRKHRWLGHVIRGEGLLLTVIEGRMVGKKTRGRRRLNMLSDMVGGTPYVQTKRKAENRITWRESGRNRRSSVSQTCSSAED